MKTKYLIPQTEAMLLAPSREMMDPIIMSPTGGGPGVGGGAPARDGFAPGGGDLGGVPAN